MLQESKGIEKNLEKRVLEKLQNFPARVAGEDGGSRRCVRRRCHRS
jgi:hypothetical protein